MQVANVASIFDALEHSDANLMPPVDICLSVRCRTGANNDYFAQVETVLMPNVIHFTLLP